MCFKHHAESKAKLLDAYFRVGFRVSCFVVFNDLLNKLMLCGTELYLNLIIHVLEGKLPEYDQSIQGSKV